VKGKVYLVGAGPGDPDLLTVKALRLLRSADAVLHDDLVTAAILSLASPTAQLLNVGKRCGAKKITQEEINFFMISLAGSGLTVVRLKSGDPLIFGRAGEEIEALRRAGIDYEIVPGITAAFGAAAAAGIPLTHRRISHALVFMTGQHAAGTEQNDRRRLVSSEATLVIYMPHELGKIASRLKSAGLENDTPCAIVASASMADQQVHLTTVENLSHAPSFSTPTLLIVGEVVRFARPDLAAFAGLARREFTGASSPAAARQGQFR
jgi:uroporphyrin-III C-methyltransferase